MDARYDIKGALLYSEQRWGNEQRRRYRAQLYEAMRLLLDFPERGRSREEHFPGCRSIPVEQHVVFSHLTDDEAVDRVLHSSQDATGKVTP